MSDITAVLTLIVLGIVIWRLAGRNSKRQTEIQALRQKNDALQKELTEARQNKPPK